MKIRKNDFVIITSGKRRGEKGRVLKINHKSQRAIVEGRNMVKRHRKATQQGEEGTIVTMEAPIHVSNLMIYSEQAGRGVRVCMKYQGANGELFDTRHAAKLSFSGDGMRVQKVRFCRKTGEIFE